MFSHLLANDIDDWAERFLSALGERRQRPSILSGLRQFFAYPVGQAG
jgi:hypothetical protein